MNELSVPEFYIPISVILIPFGIFMVLYILYSIFNIYHLIKYGIYGFGLYLLTTVFTGGAIILIVLSANFLFGYNWDANFSLDLIFGGQSNSIFTTL